MMTPRQCDDEGNTAMMTKPRQCDDEGDTMMATTKPRQCDSEGTAMTRLLLRTDSWYVSECFVASGLPTVRIWDCANAGCHSWNPLTCLLSRFVPLMEG